MGKTPNGPPQCSSSPWAAQPPIPHQNRPLMGEALLTMARWQVCPFQLWGAAGVPEAHSVTPQVIQGSGQRGGSGLAREGHCGRQCPEGAHQEVQRLPGTGPSLDRPVPDCVPWVARKPHPSYSALPSSSTHSQPIPTDPNPLPTGGDFPEGHQPDFLQGLCVPCFLGNKAFLLLGRLR